MSGSSDKNEGQAPKKRRFAWGFLLTLGLLGFFIINGVLKGSNCNFGNPRISATVAQVKSYSAAIVTFREMYGALPGDMPNAGAKIIGCTGESGKDCNPPTASAGDNIIGSRDFVKTLKPEVTGKTTIPATSAGDETILFWSHLLLTNFIGGVTTDGIKNGSDIAFGVTIPEAKTGGGFIVGYSDGTPVPETLSPPNEGLKGTILVQISGAALSGKAELNTPQMQALLPIRAAQIDRKMDDGRPLTGYVRGFGAPDCLSGKIDDELHNGVTYNETNSQKDCNLIYLIDPQP